MTHADAVRIERAAEKSSAALDAELDALKQRLTDRTPYPRQEMPPIRETPEGRISLRQSKSPQ